MTSIYWCQIDPHFNAFWSLAVEGNVFEFNCRLDSLSSHCPGKARE